MTRKVLSILSILVAFGLLTTGGSLAGVTPAPEIAPAVQAAPLMPQAPAAPTPCGQAEPGPPRSMPTPAGGTARPSGTVQKDVTYCTIDGAALTMDIYTPHTSRGSPAPVALYVHGGGWRAGDKSRGEGIKDIPELVGRGYLVAAVNYRLAPRYRFPAQIEDVKCAVRYLRANAASYNLDPNRIGAWGGSAGGNLVALLGVADPGAGLEGTDGCVEQSSRVQAVVDMFGPTDLTANGFYALHESIFREVFGATSPQDPALARASPVRYVSKDSPPFLILQGDRDHMVPPNQSQELYDRLTAAGVLARLVVVRNAGHLFAPSGGTISPSRAELTTIIADFFDKTLRNK